MPQSYDREIPKDADGSFSGGQFSGSASADDALWGDDLSSVQADDALLDALGNSDRRVSDAFDDHDLNALLTAWRRDIEAEPLRELVDVPTALQTMSVDPLSRKRAQRQGRRKMLVPVAAAAAVLSIALVGSGIAARDAQPGDALWGLTQVLYTDHARSVQAASAVRQDLDLANVALTEGRLDEARQALAAAGDELKNVSSADDDLITLTEQHNQLSTKLGTPSLPEQPSSGVTPPTSGESSSPSESSPLSQLNQSTSPTPPTSSSSSEPTPPSSSSTPTPTPSSSSTASGTSPREDSTNPTTSEP